MKQYLTAAVMIALTATAAEQTTPYGKAEFVATNATTNQVTEISFLSPSIVNVRRYMSGSTVERHNLVVTMDDADVPVTTTSSAGITLIASDSLTVSYNENTGSVAFLRNSETLLSEAEGGTTLTSTTDGTAPSYNVSQKFSLTDGEAIYGLGQIQNGTMNQRGADYYYMVEGNTCVWIPYIHSTKGYALFWDNASPSFYNESDGNLTFTSNVGFGVDYYFMLGSETDGTQTVAQMRRLSGSVPLMPLWAYGFFQSKERYKSAEEVMGVVREYRRLQVPIDCIVQDWQYWGDNSNWNGMEFSAPGYASDYQMMIDSVHNMNAHMIISTWANFGPQSKPFAYFKENNMLIKRGDEIMTNTYPSYEGVAIYDTYNPAARDKYWEFIYNGLISKGIDGYWLDSSEPDHYEDGDMREETFNFMTGMNCTWRSVRNAFPLVHVGGVYDHHRATAALDSKRVAILTRSAYAGQQRYGANTWSGDVTGNWQTLANQIPAALNFSATGNPNWNSDIGGFFCTSEVGSPGKENYNELYARWFQFGTFTPMMRSHGAGTDKAIYVWGQRGQKWFDAEEKYIGLRYRMLPYIYSTAWQVHQHGKSFMTAMGVAFPQDTETHDIKDQYMWGDAMLVAPVVKAGQTEKDVYLPQQNNWTDFWTGETYDGGQTVPTDADYATIPLYVKQGAILPWGRKQDHAATADWDTLQIRVYPGADGDFTLYEDSGDSYAYEKGERSLITFHWDDATKQLTVGARQGSYAGMAEKRVFDIVIVGTELGTGDELSSKANKRIEYTGTAQTVTVNSGETFDIDYTELTPSLTSADLHFSLSDFNPDIQGDGTYADGTYSAAAKGFGGWWLSAGYNLSGYKYLVAKLDAPVSEGVALRVYSNADYSTVPVSCKSDGSSTILVADVSEIASIFGCGFWSLGQEDIKINDVYLTAEMPAGGQLSTAKPYTFNATEWISGDGGRVSQDNISYSDNTITVNATGDQNVCLQLNADKSDAYTIKKEQHYLTVIGSGLKDDATTAQLWFAMGRHIGTATAKKCVTLADGQVATVFDIDEYVTSTSTSSLSLNHQYIFCFGLTSADGEAVISDINFYSEEELEELGIEMAAQKSYTFRAQDWVTGDAGRVAQENFTYNTDDNTITVKAEGNCNVALSLNTSRSGFYTISPSQRNLVIKGTNLSQADGDSQMWFAMGNWIGIDAPSKIINANDGETIIVFDLQKYLSDDETIALSTTGDFIFCLGLTSTTGTSTISTIDLLTDDELENTTTDISDAVTTTPRTANGKIYNVMGVQQRAANMPMGIYIKDGKKFIVR